MRSTLLALPVVLAMLLPAPGARAQEPVASASGAPASAEPFVPPARWARASVPDAPAGIAFADVVAGGPGFIAVGGGWRDGADTPTAEIWVSSTGTSWTRLALAGDASVGQIRAITVTPWGFVAVGGRCCPDQALVWRSPDGLEWEVLPDDPLLADAAMMGVTTLPDASVVAIGCSAVMECMSGLSWRSQDALTWEAPVLLELLPMDVVAAAGGVVAVGATDPYEGDPAAAISVDGRSWAAAGIDVRRGTLLGAVGYPEGAIAVGATRGTRATDPAGLLMGTDGTDWGDLPGAAIPGATFQDALWLGGDPGTGSGGMLIGGWTQDGSLEPGAWWSTDGETWEPGVFPASMKGEGMLVALAEGRDGVIVAVGSMLLNRGEVPAAWVSQSGGG